MDPERWRRIEEIYHLACAQSANDREALLDRACGADLALRQEVQSLLDQSAPTQALLAIQNTAPPTAVGTDVPANRSGQRFGVLVLESRLGSGGMGEVYRARDTRLQRNVAIKVLHAAAAGAEEVKRRLLREARAAAALDHPNICPIYEVGDADGVSFIVMPCFEGETLAARIARCGASRPMSDDEAGCIAIVLQIAAALAEAHRHGIVHRDIKPANVMLTSHELVKVLDFGLASAASQPTRETTVLDSTALPGVVAGTVPYMSPEQVRGEPVDVRTDIFSLGVVAYQLLTGERPFTRPSMADMISAILTLEPDGLRDQNRISSDLRRILRKCLEKQRADRYPTMDELMAELSSVRDRRLGLPALVVAGARVPAPPMIAAAACWDLLYRSTRAPAARRPASCSTRGEKLTDPDNQAAVMESVERASKATVLRVVDPYTAKAIQGWTRRLRRCDLPMPADEIGDAARDELERSASPAKHAGMQVEFGGGLVTEEPRSPPRASAS